MGWLERMMEDQRNRPTFKEAFDAQREKDQAHIERVEQLLGRRPTRQGPVQQTGGGQGVQQHVTVNVNRGRCNHLFHFVMTVFTFGLWLPVWLVCAIASGS